MPALFIEDGYTETAVLRAGETEVKVTYRPALYAARVKYARESAQAKTPEAAAIKAAEAIAAQVVHLNDEQVEPARLAKLHPAWLSALLDLVLGYDQKVEAADAGN